MNLIQRVSQINIDNKSNVLKMYETAFEVFCKFPGVEYHTSWKCDVLPIIHLLRNASQALQSYLKETLNSLKVDNIIPKINKPTDWVLILMFVEKPNGLLRLCLDPRDLNLQNGSII